jgi:Na+/phosphate symporter
LPRCKWNIGATFSIEKATPFTVALKKIKHKYEFSREGAAELESFHKRIIENLKLAFSVFLNEDVKLARKLIEEKTRLWSAELVCAENHLARLREGRPESIETSSLHLDVRDLKRIHSHICSVAYPVLEAAGDYSPTVWKRAIMKRLPTSCRRRRNPDSDGNEGLPLMAGSPQR